MGYSTYAGGNATTPEMEVNFKVVGIIASAYFKADDAQDVYYQAEAKLRKVESKPTNVGVCRLQEKVLRLLWAWEDAQDDREVLLESLETLAEEGHEVEGNLIKDYNPKEVAQGLVGNIVSSIIGGVALMHLPWGDDGKLLKGAETSLQKGIGKAYGRIKASKGIDKDAKGLILAGLQAYRGGKLRRDLNKAYKAYCEANHISWKTGELL